MPPRLVPASEGYAYAVLREDGLIKLGYSTDMKGRLSAIKYAVKMPVEQVYAISGTPEQVCHIEGLAHRIAADRRVEGEWFQLTVDEAVDILTRAANVFIDGGPGILARPKVPKSDTAHLKIAVLLTPDLERRLSAWRASQEDIPSASGAIKELLARALDAEEALPKGRPQPARTTISAGSHPAQAPAAGAAFRRIVSVPVER